MGRTPGAGLKELRRLFPRLYASLREHDSEWLEDNRPPVRKSGPKTSSVDWGKRDAELETKVRDSASNILLSLGAPRRVTKTAIASELGLVTLLQQKLSKLPRTAKMLSSVIESREEFAVRRIRYAAVSYGHASRVPKRWELIQRANVYSLKNVAVVKRAIDKALVDIMSGRYSPIRDDAA
jgi:hypothetical protein